MTSTTAALIVRDEERCLPGCLESLRGFVDDVVLVDTGSSDSTLQIARAAGARISTFTWTGDFSAARNAALDHVKTAWVLYIDADERLSVPSGGLASPGLDLAQHAGGYVRFKPRPGYTRYLEPRLFRSDPAIRFRYAIHETIVPDLATFAASHHLTVVPTSLCLDHYGFEGDQAHKIARNLPLLRAEVVRHPGRSYCWHHLAEMLALAGQSQEAISACRHGLATEPADGSLKAQADRRQLTQTFARLLIADSKDATEVIDQLLQEDPEDWAVLFMKGCTLLAQGDPEGALGDRATSGKHRSRHAR